MKSFWFLVSGFMGWISGKDLWLMERETLKPFYCASVNLSEIPALIFEVGTWENT
jgi:hypothetical protein